MSMVDNKRVPGNAYIQNNYRKPGGHKQSLHNYVGVVNQSRSNNRQRSTSKTKVTPISQKKKFNKEN